METLKGIIRYIKYIIRHKYFVGKACFKMGLYRQGLIHDMSKLSRHEFMPYMRYYTIGDKSKESEEAFDKARQHHIVYNPHHWEHWVVDGNAKEMPEKYRKEMLCDWWGTGRGFCDKNDLWKYKYCEWFEVYSRYLKNKDKINLHENTKEKISCFLNTQQFEARRSAGTTGRYNDFEKIYPNSLTNYPNSLPNGRLKGNQL